MKDELLKPWNAEQWLSAFGKAESDTHMLHALRKQVYEYTVQGAMQGSYEIIKTDPETNAKQIKTVSLALDPDIAKKTKMYRYEQQPAIQKRYDKTEYKVLSQDCLATAKAFVEQNEGKVAVLNLASRKNPGGGVYGGAGAQEEYCFRCSDYFRSLYQYKDYGPDYGVERSGESYPMDRNFGGVYSPNVTIFRGTEAEGYPFLEKPWKVNFIAVAGINNPDTMTGKDGRKWMTPPMVAITRNKLRTILNIAIDNEVDILVLGAIGCGAFHNPPHHVAHLFKEIFAEPAYAHAFKKVVFAIKKDHNSRKTELARIFEEIIERKEYDLIERPDPSKEFLQYRHQAMVRLNDKFKKLYGLAHDEQADFRWIKTDLTSPDFEDFAFAYRQQIFSVIVEQANVEKDGKFAFGNPGRVAMLRQICYENNLIPCIYPIIKKDGANVFLGIWNLVHAETREFVDPTSLSSDEPVEVSGWEFRNWAIQIVINYIKEQGFQLLSYCDMPGIDPQIWFKNAEGNNCWIEVLPITPGNKPTFSLEGFPSSVLKYDGYVAEVSFAASENDRVSKIFRAKGADVEFEGIKKIHDKNQG